MRRGIVSSAVIVSSSGTDSGRGNEEVNRDQDAAGHLEAANEFGVGEADLGESSGARHAGSLPTRLPGVGFSRSLVEDIVPAPVVRWTGGPDPASLVGLRPVS